MPRIPRGVLLPLEGDLDVLCTSRAGRGTYPLGIDRALGVDRSHRRTWVVDRTLELVDVFAIRLVEIAVLDNHFHVLLRLLRSLAASWTAEEVVERWLRLTGRRLSDEARDRRRAELLADPVSVSALRQRLAHPADFHKHLKQPIAMQANREDGVSGPFWAGRYHCLPIASDDERARIAADLYVDHNELRAGMVEKHEDATHSSIRARIDGYVVARENDARRSGQARSRRGRQGNRGQRRRSRRSFMRMMASKARRARLRKWLTIDPDEMRHAEDGLRILPIESREGDEGLSRTLSLEAYLRLVDETGRRAVPGKRGVVPAGLAPILERLRIDGERLMDAVRRERPRPGSIIGDAEACRTEAMRRGVRSVRSAMDVSPRPPRRGIRGPVDPPPGGPGRTHGFGADEPFD